MHTLCLFFYVHLLYIKLIFVWNINGVRFIPKWIYAIANFVHFFSIRVLIRDACATAAFFFLLLVNRDVSNSLYMVGHHLVSSRITMCNPAFAVTPLRFCASFKFKRLTTVKFVASPHYYGCSRSWEFAVTNSPIFWRYLNVHSLSCGTSDISSFEYWIVMLTGTPSSTTPLDSRLSTTNHFTSWYFAINTAVTGWTR